MNVRGYFKNNDKITHLMIARRHWVHSGDLRAIALLVILGHQVDLEVTCSSWYSSLFLVRVAIAFIKRIIKV